MSRKDTKDRLDKLAFYCLSNHKECEDRDDYNEIIDNCFLGDSGTAQDKKLLKKLGITHVLNAAQGDRYSQVDTDQRFYNDVDIEFYGCNLMDFPGARIEQFLDEGVEFIHQAVDIKRGRVLVHCFMGVSRSAAFLIAYMIKHRRYRLEDAIRYVSSKRYIAPNEGFLLKLIEYESRHSK